MALLGHKRLTARWLTAAAVAVIMLMSFVGAALAAETEPLQDIGLTINQTSGAKPTRFTFTATTNAPVQSIKLTFPEGFDVQDAAANAVILEGLQRLPVEVTQRIDAGAVDMSFEPVPGAESNVRVQIVDVIPPAEGGEYAVAVEYVSEGQTYEAETPSFEFEAVTPSEQLSQWLSEQQWVETWNSVEFFRIFVQPQQIALAVPLLFRGWLMSITLVVIAFPLAIAGGLTLAFMKMARLRIVRGIASIYINVIRGTPLFLQIFIAFIGLPLVGFRMPLYVTGVVVLALNSSAYLAEIFRAGIQSIHKGQLEAASSLGMTYAQSMAFVIIPQTVKRVLPTMTSEFILLFKDTALLSAVGVFELMLFSRTLSTRSGNLTPFMVAAAYYLLVTIPLINWVATLEKKLAISEGGQVPVDESKQKRSLWASLTRRSTPSEAPAPEAVPQDQSRS